MLKAVLFDLDDTLFDHGHCVRAALALVHAAHPCFAGIPFTDFERHHADVLEEMHVRVLSGEMSVDLARQQRFRRLFAAAGMTVDEVVVEATALSYRDRYRSARRAIAGATALLAALKGHAQIGIVSNNILEEQQSKIRHCGLEPYIDVLIVSEEAGSSKPDPAIFRLTLARLGCEAGAAVMIGDSWSADVDGARAAGIRAIWFNPSARPQPEPEADVIEIRRFEPLEDALDLILDRRPSTQRIG